MRFREFKILKEATGTLFTIGDSHAVAVATTGGKDWVNLAINGKSSTDAGMLANIAKVPKGATVLVSQGANDTTIALSQGAKTPPQTIAANVANVVDRVKAQGANVTFLLFPIGQGRGDTKYQEQVRAAIKNAIGDTPVIDLNGKPLQQDQVHAQMGVYKEVANQVRAKVTTTAPQPAQGGATQPSAGQLAVPQGRSGTEIADIQKVLIKLGYPLPQHGVDGIRGPETSAAVSAFQKDNGLTVDGDPGPDTVGALNKLVASKGITFDKSTAKDVKAGAVGTRELAPLAQDAVTKGKVGKVLDFIAGPESGGHYDIMMGGKREPEILKMTVTELLQYQQRYKASGAETAAAGRYQYMPGTLRDYCKRMGVNIEKQTFDPKFQDDLAIYTMRFQCKLDGWLEGKVDDGTFMNLLAQVWAGIPKTSGQSAYQGVGSNKAGIKADVALNTLQTIRQA